MHRRSIAKKRTTPRRLTAALCAISMALAGAPALSAPTASDKETARALMKDGEAKRSKGDHKGAHEAFRAAHAIMNVPTTGLELGRAQAELGMLVEARDTLLGVTRLPVVAGESANMPAAREEAQKLADEIEPRIPSLKIVLQNVPSGASPNVTVDGVPILAATIGVPRKHNPGSHEVVVVVGSVEKKTTVELVEGETKDLSIDVAPEVEKEVPKNDDGLLTDEPPPAPSQPTRSSLVWIGFGSAAAFGAIGAVTGVLAFSKASAAKDGCEGTRCPPATHGDVESSRTFGTISTVSFVLAGAGAVVGFIGLMSSKSEGERPAVAAPRGPSVGVFFGATGVGLSGAF